MHPPGSLWHSLKHSQPVRSSRCRQQCPSAELEGAGEAVGEVEAGWAEEDWAATAAWAAAAWVEVDLGVGAEEAG